MTSERVTRPPAPSTGPTRGDRQVHGARSASHAADGRWTDARVLVVTAFAVGAAMAAGRVFDIAGIAALDPIPFAVVTVVAALLTGRRWAGSAVLVVAGPLLVSRSILAPTALSALAPLTAAAAAAVFLVIHARRVRLRPAMAAVVVLALLLVLPAIVGADTASVQKGIGVGAMWALVFVVAANTSVEERRLLATAFVVVMSGEAVVAMTESFLQLDFTRRFIAGSVSGAPYGVGPNLLIGSWATRSFGTIGHPIPLSLLLVLAIVLVAGTWRRGGALLRIVAVTVLVGGVLATGARSALVMMLAAAIVLVIAAARRVRRRRALVWATLGIIVLVLAGAAGSLLVRSLTSNDFSAVHRGGMVESALRLFGQPIDRVLFGFGYNAPVRLHAIGVLGSDDLNVVDNTLVTQFATAGLVGLVLLLALVVLAFVRGGTLIRGCIAACMAAMFFFDLQSWHLVMVIFWFVIACGIYPSGIRGAGEASGAPRWRRRIPARRNRSGTSSH